MARSAPFPSPEHDHDRCVVATLAAAEGVCTRRKARLTERRRRVLEIVAESHAAIGAYDILERLAGEGGRPAPITVYRALDFLMEHGLVHRVASLNAYVTCSHPDAEHGAQFLICRDCGWVAELDDAGIGRAISLGARAALFAVAEHVVEVAGLCRNCRAEERARVAD